LSDILNFQALYIRRHHSDAVFLMNVYNGAKCFSSVIERDSIRVPTRNLRKFDIFSCSSSPCPAARCASAVNAVCISTDPFRNLRFYVNNVNWFDLSLFFACVVLVLVLLQLLFCICSDSVIGHWLLSSARK
jgi:hypothetical protein